MTEITDLSPTDASNTEITGESLDGAVANMSRMDNTLQAILGMFGRWTGSGTIASATTTNIGASPETYLTVSGTTTITGFGTVRAGTIRFLRFSGVLTLTHNGTTLILPGSASITTAAGDVAVFASEGAGNWRCLLYSRSTGSPVRDIYATKVDVRRNRIVNGDKLVSQENAQTSGTTNGRYISDQNAMFFVTSNGVFTGVNVAGRTSPAGGNRDRITITTPDTVLAAGEFLTYTQNIEGSSVGDLKWGTASAIPLIVRRGIRAPQGTWPVAFHNSATNRSYVTTFTVSALEANTDIVREFAIPGDTTGTWLTADGVIGLTMDFVIGAGSTFQGVSGWQAGNMLTVAGATNGMGIAAAVFEFFDEGMKADPASTGVYGQYEAGYVHPVWRSERYWEAFNVAISTFYNGNGPSVGYAAPVLYPTTKAIATPSVSFTNLSSSNISVETAAFVSQHGFSWSLTMAATGNASRLSTAKVNSRLI